MCEWLDRVEERNRKIGAEAKAKEAARNLFNMGMAPADIAKALNEALSEVQKWLDLAPV